jgi:hypothetical protein
VLADRFAEFFLRRLMGSFRHRQLRFGVGYVVGIFGDAEHGKDCGKKTGHRKHRPSFEELAYICRQTAASPGIRAHRLCGVESPFR